MQKHGSKRKGVRIFVHALAIVILFATAFAGAGCVKQLDLSEASAAIAEAAEGRPVLLYISKTGWPYCDSFDAEWEKAKKEYGDKVYFHFTKRGKSGDADALWKEYSLEFNDIKGSPALVWINSKGEAVRGVSGLTSCRTKMWNALGNGSENWWQPT